MATTDGELSRRQHVWLFAAVCVLSAAMLAVQVLQVVVLSLQLFPEAAFLVVSFCMLGLATGGSVATALLHRRPPRNVPAALCGTAVTFAASAFVAFLMTSRLHGLVPLIIVNTAPHVFAGFVLSLTFATWPDDATRIYFFDLVGAAAGCVAIVMMLNGLGDAGAVAAVLALMGAMSAVLVAFAFRLRGAIAAGLVLAASIALVARARPSFEFTPAPGKFYAQLLAKGSAGGTVARQRWNFLGRVDAFIPGPAVAEFDFARQAKDLMDAGCAFRLLFSNGYNWTFTVDFAGAASKQHVFDRWIQNAPYMFTDRPAVLNLGSGGGADVYLALANGARSAIAVEINPLMIEATTAWYPHDWDGLWSRPEVVVRELDARTFVNTTDQRFDVITLNAVDTAAAQASLLSVNFLYTVEAFSQYLDVLHPGGVIFLTRPRAQLLRALAAAMAAFRRRGVAAVERHALVLGSGDLASAAVYLDPLTAPQIDTVRREVGEGRFGALLYAPDTDVGPNLFADYFDAARIGEDAAYFRRIDLRAEPVTDDQPYFYQLERSFFGSVAGRLLVLIFTFVMTVGMLLIFAPLRGFRMQGKNREVAAHLVYFACLGVGFMLVEICLLQQLSLVLGHPAYSVSVTLAGMLVCCGLGSLVAGKLPPRWRAHEVTGVLLASALAIALFSVTVAHVARAGPESLAGRILLCLAFLAPGSFVMGMPFPLKLRAVARHDVGLVPWAWAVNGLGSVAGSVLAVALTMNFGFRAVLLVAAGLYLVALAAHHAQRT